MSIGTRRFRAGIYWYVDVGRDGRSDPAYIKQESTKSDGNWWCSLDSIDGDEVIRGGKPEYRKRGMLGFNYKDVPLLNPTTSLAQKGVVIVFEETSEIFVANAIIQRIVNNQHVWQVRVELMHEEFNTATYSDGYYYAD